MTRLEPARASGPAAGTRGRRVSVVLPVFNECAVLRQLTETLCEVGATSGYDFEIVFVNDGSTDGSTELLDRLAVERPEVRVVHFSRNFGHQAALQAGLTTARGDAIVIMDSDLQDEPVAILDFLERWEAGFDVVYAVRFARKENVLKRALFYSFYRVLQRVSYTPMPSDAGNFGLIDRRVAGHIVQLPEVARFYPGLRSWVGYRQCGVPVERKARHDDKPRVSLRGLLRLARTAIFSFSTAPLAFFYGVAGVSCVVCTGLTSFVLYHRLGTGLAIPGWSSELITASFFGALNALGIAVLGEYVTRIFDQVRGRPQFIIARTVNVPDPGQPLPDGVAPGDPSPAAGDDDWVPRTSQLSGHLSRAAAHHGTDSA